MTGSKLGGAKAAARLREKYGKDYFARIGKKGGKASRTGGFASEEVGEDGLTGRERAVLVGAIGGSISSRTGVKNGHSRYSKK